MLLSDPRFVMFLFHGIVGKGKMYFYMEAYFRVHEPLSNHSIKSELFRSAVGIWENPVFNDMPNIFS